MAEYSGGSVEIEIQSNAQKAVSELNRLLGVLKEASKEVTTLSVGIEGFGKSIKAISNSINSMATSLKKIPDLSSSVDALKSTSVGEAFSSLSTQIQPFISKLKEAEAGVNSLAVTSKALGKTNIPTANIPTANVPTANVPTANVPTANVPKPKVGFLSNFTNLVKSSTANTRILGETATKADKSFSKLFSFGRVYAFANYTRQIGVGIAKSIKSAADYAEVVNIFTVSMQSMTGEATKFANTISETFGLALPDVMRFQAQFNNILKAMGQINAETAYNLSETLTKMSVDFSSLFNVSVESAMTKFQSALTSQVRPIRSTSGFDITQQTLQGYAERLGIVDRTVRSMSQMEKRLLTIYALQQQMATSGAIGDYSRTVESASNQLKIFSNQLKEAARWVGSFILKYIGPALPYLNGFVMAIKEIIKSLATLVGYEVEGVSDVEDLLTPGEALDDLDEAKKKIKEIKDISLGIDELNIVKPNDSDGDSDDKITGGGYIDPRITAGLKEYDNLMDGVRMKAMDIRDTILEWFEALKKDPVGVLSATLWDFLDWLFDMGDLLAGGKMSKQALEGLAFGLETLIGALALSTMLKLPFPLALAISTLMTSGIVDLLGTENGLLAIGSGLSAIAAALTVYKLTGNPMAAAISGLITAGLLVLIEKNTKINILAPALSGVAGSLLLFTKISGLGTVAIAIGGIATALAAFSFLNDFPGGLDLMLWGVAGALGGFTVAAKMVGGIETLADAFELLRMKIGWIFGAAGLAVALAAWLTFTDGFESNTATVYTGLASIGTGIVTLGITVRAAIDIATMGLAEIVGVIVAALALIVGGVVALSKECLPEAKRFAKETSEETKAILGPLMDLSEKATGEITEIYTNAAPITADGAAKISSSFKKMADDSIKEINRLKNQAINGIAAIYGEEAVEYQNSINETNDYYDKKIDALKSTNDELYENSLKALDAHGKESQAYKDAYQAYLKGSNGMQASIAKENAAREGALGILKETLSGEALAYDQQKTKVEEVYDGKIKAVTIGHETINREIKDKLKTGETLTEEGYEALLGAGNVAMGLIVGGVSKSTEEAIGIWDVYQKDLEGLNRRELAKQIEIAAEARDEKVKDAKTNYENQLFAYELHADEMDERSRTEAYNQLQIAKTNYDDIAAEATTGFNKVVTAVKAVDPDIEEAVDVTTGKVLNKWKEFFRSFGKLISDSFKKIFGNDDTTGLAPPTSTVTPPAPRGSLNTSPKVPTFADGGFPKRGAFVMNEGNSAEMLGNINGKTAVVNNDQIIQGISIAVSSTQGEQNQLLRKQNDLLSSILRKDSNLYITKREIAKYSEEGKSEMVVSSVKGVFANVL